MSSVAASPGHSSTASALRRLYFVRFVFAVVWALILFTTAKDIGPLAAILLVLYPLFDVGAAIYDLRSSRKADSPALLYVNIAVSLIAAVGVGVAAASNIPAVLRVWGAWAIVAGLVQLMVSVTRRKMGGHLPVIISGGLSVLVGAAFISLAGADNPTLAYVAGYAIAGGVFFLVSALWLNRTVAKGN
ncbi:hypothetical protein [Micromonospora sp. B9E7]|uniref:hypothetical protein n=1 Tax=Micromonospora sp. B9E7 TaxID=3153574 RepID=UPI00325DD2D0